jgi:tRNA-Thr(GGU) m(6)t(6)A37 methyltransferase TsaA
MSIVLEPIAIVHSTRRERTDGDWDREEVRIELTDAFPAEALDGIEEFSHAEVVFHFDRVDPASIEYGARHPRHNTSWPRVGIFAQRASARPNRLGATIVRITGRSGRTLYVSGLDAIDGTPVLDIKPVLTEFLPRGEVRQPAWSRELMRDYWQKE